MTNFKEKVRLDILMVWKVTFKDTGLESIKNYVMFLKAYHVNQHTQLKKSCDTEMHIKYINNVILLACHQSVFSIFGT